MIEISDHEYNALLKGRRQTKTAHQKENSQSKSLGLGKRPDSSKLRRPTTIEKSFRRRRIPPIQTINKKTAKAQPMTKQPFVYKYPVGIMPTDLNKNQRTVQNSDYSPNGLEGIGKMPLQMLPPSRNPSQAHSKSLKAKTKNEVYTRSKPTKRQPLEKDRNIRPGDKKSKLLKSKLRKAHDNGKQDKAQQVNWWLWGSLGLITIVGGYWVITKINDTN